MGKGSIGSVWIKAAGEDHHIKYPRGFQLKGVLYGKKFGASRIMGKFWVLGKEGGQEEKGGKKTLWGYKNRGKNLGEKKGGVKISERAVR